MKVLVAAGNLQVYAHELAACLEFSGHETLLVREQDFTLQAGVFQPDAVVCCGPGFSAGSEFPVVQVVSTVEQNLLPGADYFVFTCRSAVHGNHKGRLAVIPQPVSPGRFRPVSPGDGHTVLSAGRLCPEAGHRTLIKAMAFVNSRYNAVFVGNSGDCTAEQMRRFAFELGVGDRVTVTEEIEDVDLLMGKASLGVETSLTEQPVSFSSAVDFMCSGVPLLTSAVRGLRDVVTDGVTCVYHSPGNAGQLARQINYLMGNRGVAMNIAGNALSFCEKEFSFNSVGSRWTAVLEQLSFR